MLFKFQLFTSYCGTSAILKKCRPDANTCYASASLAFPVEISIISIVQQMVKLRNRWKLAQLTTAARPKSTRSTAQKDWHKTSDTRKKILFWAVFLPCEGQLYSYISKELHLFYMYHKKTS